MTARDASPIFPVGCSVEGRPIIARTNFANFAVGDAMDAAGAEGRMGPSGVTLLLGGIHGDEAAGVLLLERFAEEWLGRVGTPTAIIAVCNPDGYERRTRTNARGVDLNRNFPRAWRVDSAEPSGGEPWSEPESVALRDVILRWKPRNIVTLHWALGELDSDGPQSSVFAQALWDALGEEDRRPYRLRLSPQEAVSAECPGSLGQWCGHELRYADGSAPSIVTLELPYDPAVARPDPLPEGHLGELHRRWELDARGYLEAVEPGVFKMLLAACRFSS